MKGNAMTVNGVYNFSKFYYLVEITFDLTPDEIDWFGFSVPEEGVSEFDRVIPYMEQYLTTDGLDKLCDAWDEPEEQEKPTRVAFFIKKSTGNVLETPYGDVPLSSDIKTPERLRKIIEFEKE